MKNDKIRLYYYTKAETLDKILSSGLIRLTAISEANDPFEGSIQHPKPDAAISESLKQACEKSTWDSYIKEEPPLVICFSTTMSSPSMWGHYADKHQGVCLVFDVPVHFFERGDEMDENDKNNARAIFPIEYTDEKPSVRNMKYENEVDIYQRMKREASIHKGKEWSFENEVRIEVADALCSPEKHADIVWKDGWPYFKGLMGYLRGVILGVRCKKLPIWVDCCLKQLEYNHVLVARAEVSSTHYKIIARTSNGVEFVDSCSDVNKIKRLYEISNNGIEVDRLWFVLPSAD